MYYDREVKRLMQSGYRIQRTGSDPDYEYVVVGSDRLRKTEPHDTKRGAWTAMIARWCPVEICYTCTKPQWMCDRDGCEGEAA